MCPKCKISKQPLVKTTFFCEFLNNRATVTQIYEILINSYKAKENNHVREKIRQVLNSNSNFYKTGEIWSLCIE